MKKVGEVSEPAEEKNHPTEKVIGPGELGDWFRKNETGKVPTDISYTDPATGERVKVMLEASVVPGKFKAELREKAVSTNDETGDMSFNNEKYDDLLVGMTFHFSEEDIRDIKENKPIGVWDAIVVASMRINSMYVPKRKAEAIKN